MSEDNYRTIFAIGGLIFGVALMVLAGFSGLLPGALFGAGGAVAGGIIGEKLYTRNNR